MRLHAWGDNAEISAVAHHELFFFLQFSTFSPQLVAFFPTLVTFFPFSMFRV